MAATVTVIARAANLAKVAQKDLAVKAVDRVAKAVVTDAAAAVDEADVAAVTAKGEPSANALMPKANP